MSVDKRGAARQNSDADESHCQATQPDPFRQSNSGTAVGLRTPALLPARGGGTDRRGRARRASLQCHGRHGHRRQRTAVPGLHSQPHTAPHTGRDFHLRTHRRVARTAQPVARRDRGQEPQPARPGVAADGDQRPDPRHYRGRRSVCGPRRPGNRARPVLGQLSAHCGGTAPGPPRHGAFLRCERGPGRVRTGGCPERVAGRWQGRCWC